MLELAKQRMKNTAVENNLHHAAAAEKKRRESTMIVVNPENTKKEMDLLDAILKKEESHWQWFKHGLCGFTLMAQVLINLTRGSKTQESLFFGMDYYKCTWYDFTVSGFYILICILVTMVAIRRVNYE